MDVGEYLRDGDAQHIALVPIYAPVTQSEWDEVHQPYLGVQLNAQPLSKWARCDMPAAATQAQPLVGKHLLQLAGVAEKHLGTVLDSFRPDLGVHFAATSQAGATARGDLNLILGASASRTAHVVPLTLAPWRLSVQGVERTGALLKALETLKDQKRILGYTLTRERPLTLCGDVVMLLVAVPVD